MVKQEARDDGYETSPDLEMRNTNVDSSSQQYHSPVTPHIPQTPITPISTMPYQQANASTLYSLVSKI